LEYELISNGSRLRWVGDRTGRVTWRDLWVMLRHADPDSTLGREMSGRTTDWTVSEHILAGVLDGIRAISWQIGGGERPKPLERPNQQVTVRGELEHAAPEGDPFKWDESGVFQGEMTPIAELNEWLGWA